ncbi:hypothetical protein GMA8713_02523 [Grimontia marina]|uniref:Uncharacterized protein n=1 Tax=Grimontia marina TaxID=646534 RepID=A0A128FA23_9GAMM|nr:hypothetical protein GMA8713_02523 [Grimontia marina]
MCLLAVGTGRALRHLLTPRCRDGIATLCAFGVGINRRRFCPCAGGQLVGQRHLGELGFDAAGMVE